MRCLRKRLFKVYVSLSIGIGLGLITISAMASVRAAQPGTIPNAQTAGEFDCKGDSVEIYGERSHSDLDWAIVLCTSDPNIMQTMEVYLDGELKGEAAYTQIHHTTEADPNKAPQVAVFNASGYVRLKPNADEALRPLRLGASAILGVSYWSESGYHHNPQLSQIRFDTSELSTGGSLWIDAAGVNQDFEISYAMELPPPTDARTTLLVEQIYTATRDIVISRDRNERAEGFKLVQLSSNYRDEATHDSDKVRYMLDNGPTSISLETREPSSFIFPDNSTENRKPLSTRYPWLDLLESHAFEAGTPPSIRIEMLEAPHDPTIVPQGWMTETLNSFDNNVSVWLSSSTYKQWNAGQRSSIRYALIAQNEPFGSSCPDEGNAICVLDEDDSPVADALVYRIGNNSGDGEGSPSRFLGQTDIRGLLVLTEPIGSSEFVALQLAHEQPTNKGAHGQGNENENVAFQVYRTSMLVTDDGEVLFPADSSENQQVDLRTDPQNTLVLFNIVVSIEWDAGDQYVQELLEGLQSASNSLFDATDGQFAFGSIAIFDERVHWEDADIRVHDSNVAWPYAYVGGISVDDPLQYQIRYRGIDPEPGYIALGRYFDGTSGHQGEWNKPNGYKTIMHEFAHYALFLFDEYFYFELDGDFWLKKESYCFDEDKMSPESRSKPASIMDFQFTKTEFCNRPEHYPEYHGGPPTHQTQMYDNDHIETSWMTIQGVYSDTLQSIAAEQSKHTPISPWRIRSPLDRGVDFVLGPYTFPLHTDISNNTGLPGTSSAKAIRVTVQGIPVGGALVSLHKANGTLPIDQGITDPDGSIVVLGGARDDRIVVRTVDSGYAGNLVLQNMDPESIALQPVEPELNLASATQAPLSQVFPLVTIIPGSRGNSMTYHADTSRPELELTAQLHGKQSPSSVAKSMSYSPTKGMHVVMFGGFQARTDLIGLNLLIRSSLSDTAPSLVGIGNHRSWTDGKVMLDVTSPDGNFNVNAQSDHLTSGRYVVVNPTNALPGPPPAGMSVVTGPYSVQGSGSEPGWEKSMALTFNYHALSLGEMAEGSLQPYYWSASESQWVPVTTTTTNAGRHQVSASYKLYGIYALMGALPLTELLYLPRVTK